MKLAYISGPYRASTPYGIIQNIRAAEAVAIELWLMGYAVICPHKNTAFLDGVCPDHVWMDGDLEILSRCDLIVMTPDWLESEGAQIELNYAFDHGIARFYWPQDVDHLKEYLKK